MKPLVLLGSSAIIIVILISAVASIQGKNDRSGKHAEVVLRDLGHQLLLAAKDSTSRVLPIGKLTENRYQIAFQNNFGFISDSLINIVQRTFRNQQLADNYIVNLRDCKKEETVLAFEINRTEGDLTPCRGRKLETGCYVIEIDLLDASGFNYFLLIPLIIPLVYAGFYAKKAISEKASAAPIIEKKEYIALGNYQFFPENNALVFESKTIELSQKETKALRIFSENLNQMVEREKLMKEIWEDEGIVVISRNVDVLVSKLRKKLADDHSLKFVNVHGRGYKFLIE